MGILSLFRRKAAPAKAEQSATRLAPRAEQRPTATGAPAPSTAAPVASSVLRAPRVTEKATILGTVNQYVFTVRGAATKPAIRRAVEHQYGVHVTGVRVVNVRGKARRRGRVVGATPGFRKAIVALRAGERIDVTSVAK